MFHQLSDRTETTVQSTKKILSKNNKKKSQIKHKRNYPYSYLIYLSIIITQFKRKLAISNATVEYARHTSHSESSIVIAVIDVSLLSTIIVPGWLTVLARKTNFSTFSFFFFRQFRY